MITAIKYQCRFYPQNLHWTPGSKCSENKLNKNLSTIWHTCTQPRTELQNAEEFMVEFISMQQNIRNVHSNWSAFLVEVPLLNRICLPPETQ